MKNRDSMVFFVAEAEQNQFIYWLDLVMLPRDEGRKRISYFQGLLEKYIISHNVWRIAYTSCFT